MKIEWELETNESFTVFRVAEALSKQLELKRLKQLVDFLQVIIKHMDDANG